MRICKSTPFVFLASALLLTSCAPRDIPRDAERHWSLKGSFRWEWSRNVEHGCAAWVAKEPYAVVYIFADAQCDGPRETGFLDSRNGVQYTSFSDQLLFLGYSDWDPDPIEDVARDEDGNSLSWPERCPYEVTQSQIDALRIVVAELFNFDLTDGERRILLRVDAKLSEIDGSALRVSYQGCVDVVNDRARRESGEMLDLWESSPKSR